MHRVLLPWTFTASALGLEGSVNRTGFK